jgi:hypothetical protein
MFRRTKAKPTAGKQSRRKEIKAAAEGKQNPQEGIPSPRHNKTFYIFSSNSIYCGLFRRVIFSRIRALAGRSGSRGRSRAGLELGGEAVQFCEQSFAGRGVVDGFPRSGLPIAVDAVEHLEKSPDRLEVAGGHRLGGEGVRAFEAHELKQRMIGRVVELLAPQDVGDDLANPPLAHAFLERDALITLAEAQPGEDALPALGLGIGIEPGPRRFAGRFDHIHVRFSFPSYAALVSKNSSLAMISEKGKKKRLLLSRSLLSGGIGSMAEFAGGPRG